MRIAAPRMPRFVPEGARCKTGWSRSALRTAVTVGRPDSFRDGDTGRRLQRAQCGRVDLTNQDVILMREWLYILVPVAAIAYIVAFPSHFIHLLNWLRGMLLMS
jgi:hypothetical protein